MAGASWKAGQVVYDGDRTVPFGQGLYAVPISALWSGTKPLPLA